MTEKPERVVPATSRIMATLREFISALDRRVPHGERPGEIRIAKDSQLLRRDAVAQLDALTRQRPNDKPDDRELVEAIMTDDGWPPARE